MADPQLRHDSTAATNGIDGDGRTVPIDAEGRATKARLPKKLIVCCDGTWMDSTDSRGLPSNVTRLARAIKSEDDAHHPQIVYYQAGVGTGIGLLDRVGGGASGLGLAENIREAYAFLASNYSPNDGLLVQPDTIFLVGFSRGAYTARSLGGFISSFGVLKRHAMSYFYDIFTDWEQAGESRYTPQFFDNYFHHNQIVNKTSPSLELARDPTKRDEYLTQYFRLLQDLSLTQEVQIQAIGVWDTVGALGIPVHPIIQKLLPFLPAFIREGRWFDTRLYSNVRNAFQALALDEHRYPYSPAIWELRPDPVTGAVPTTNLKQVWFPGAHSNVGGSYVDPGISDLTLAWMMDQLSQPTPSHPCHEHVKFDESHFDALFDERTHFAAEARPECYKGWGMGQVYDSNTFPMSLVLGTRRRTPGLYHRIIYKTSKPDPEKLLLHTNEFVHSCVRARVDLGARGVERKLPDVDQSAGVMVVLRKLGEVVFGKKKRSFYTPQRTGMALHGWKLVDGHSGHGVSNNTQGIEEEGEGEIKWVYEGKAKCANRVMKEDLLGPYWERLLLEKISPDMADELEYSNNGWKVVTKLPPREPRTSKTI